MGKLLLLDYIFNENDEIYKLIGDDFPGCLRKVDVERGHHLLLGDILFNVIFRCSGVFEVTQERFERLLIILQSCDKKIIDYST